jgi:tetratricopeptide (TPR) repeat protein
MASTETIIQLGILILTLSIFFLMHYLRNQTTQSKTRTRNKNHKTEPNRHMNQASRHLNRARSTTKKAEHAKNALIEADQALSLTPRDPSVHILRARALHIMNHRTAAIRSLNIALSLPAAKLLSPEERADALVFRAEMKLEVNRRRRVESAMEDVVEAINVSGEECENLDSMMCLLGKCYEWKGMKEEAKNLFQKVLDDVEPDSVEARKGLKRLGP